MILLRPSSDVLPDHVLMLHAEPFETHLLSAELCILFIYFLKGNCIGLEYHIILSKIHINVIIKTKIIDKNKSCSNKYLLWYYKEAHQWEKGSQYSAQSKKSQQK